MRLPFGERGRRIYVKPARYVRLHTRVRIYPYALPGHKLRLLGLLREHQPFPLESCKLLLCHSPKPFKYVKLKILIIEHPVTQHEDGSSICRSWLCKEKAYSFVLKHSGSIILTASGGYQSQKLVGSFPSSSRAWVTLILVDYGARYSMT